MALVQGAGGANIFCESVYTYISGMSAADIIVKIDEVNDESLKELLQKVCFVMLLIQEINIIVLPFIRLLQLVTSQF